MLDELEDEFLFPAQRFQAQLEVRLVVDVVLLFDARNAVVVRMDDHLRGSSVLRVFGEPTTPR